MIAKYGAEHERRGKIFFSERRITIESEKETYFVHPTKSRGFIHGDLITFVITRRATAGKLSEAKPTKLLERTKEEVLIEAQKTRKGIQWKLLEMFGVHYIEVEANPRCEEGDIFVGKFRSKKRIELIRKFGNKEENGFLEKMVFFRSGVHTEWSEEIQKIQFEGPNISTQNVEVNFGDSLLPQTLSLKSEIFPKIGVFGSKRFDFRNWYTMTIDGADAKDLDDAISIAKYEGGDTLLSVHIADVAEYVKENTPIDKEAYFRGTSIYTPGRVIPMLPEVLSNDLCSLHPGGPKLTLSILMRIDRKGYVKESFVTEGIIESRHRGIYEDIGKIMSAQVPLSFRSETEESLSNSSDEELQSSFQKAKEKGIPSGGQKNTRFLHTQEGQKTTSFPPKEILSQFSHLYHTLRERRKKEGKIIFDTTECYFDMDSEGNVENVRKRERGDAHMMIEEFMVLANEEVAKWCVKRKIPFLSRVHDAPSVEKAREIVEVVEANVSELGNLNFGLGTDILPHHIRSILEHAESDDELSYRLSRLLLPKMAKAVYGDKPLGHFGLALTHYAHFTSPIRRYPDLLLHRMIKYELSKNVSKFDKKTYDREMKRVGKSLSEKERSAEDVSRAIDDIAMCRYMSKFVEVVYDGIISGLTESNIYVELENGVEGSIYLSDSTSPLIKGDRGGFRTKEKFTLDLARGSLRDKSGKEIYRIGGKIRVKVVSVDMETRRIEMTINLLV